MADGDVTLLFLTVLSHCESATYTIVQALLSWSADVLYNTPEQLMQQD